MLECLLQEEDLAGESDQARVWQYRRRRWRRRRPSDPDRVRRRTLSTADVAESGSDGEPVLPLRKSITDGNIFSLAKHSPRDSKSPETPRAETDGEEAESPAARPGA